MEKELETREHQPWPQFKIFDGGWGDILSDNFSVQAVCLFRYKDIHRALHAKTQECEQLERNNTGLKRELDASYREMNMDVSRRTDEIRAERDSAHSRVVDLSRELAHEQEERKKDWRVSQDVHERNRELNLEMSAMRRAREDERQAAFKEIKRLKKSSRTCILTGPVVATISNFHCPPIEPPAPSVPAWSPEIVEAVRKDMRWWDENILDEDALESGNDLSEACALRHCDDCPYTAIDCDFPSAGISSPQEYRDNLRSHLDSIGLDWRTPEPEPQQEWPADVIAMVKKWSENTTGKSLLMGCNDPSFILCHECPLNVYDWLDRPDSVCQRLSWSCIKSRLQFVNFPGYETKPEPEIEEKKIEFTSEHKADGTVVVVITKQTHRGEEFGKTGRSFYHLISSTRPDPYPQDMSFYLQGSDLFADHTKISMSAIQFKWFGIDVVKYNKYFSAPEIRKRLKVKDTSTG